MHTEADKYAVCWSMCRRSCILPVNSAWAVKPKCLDSVYSQTIGLRGLLNLSVISSQHVACSMNSECCLSLQVPSIFKHNYFVHMWIRPWISHEVIFQTVLLRPDRFHFLVNFIRTLGAGFSKCDLPVCVYCRKSCFFSLGLHQLLMISLWILGTDKGYHFHRLWQQITLTEVYPSSILDFFL